MKLLPRSLRLCIQVSHVLALITMIGALEAQPASRPATFCNPLDLPYRFVLADQGPSSREAADPTVVFFEGQWWLFASKSGGYWHTSDFRKWVFVEPKGLPLEDYAPTAEVINGQLCYTVGGNNIYTSENPAEGVWKKLASMPSAGDVDLFRDEDGSVYVYSGVSDKDPIVGRRLDPKHGFNTIGDPVNVISGHPADHGWENKFVRGTGPLDTDLQTHSSAPYIEGSWMTKVNGRYFLQYAAPGTEFNSYGDGFYVGEHPLGPFTYHPANPFSFHPSGFAGGAGHGSTFKDGKGNYWHISTITIGKRRNFERRIGMFPVKFFPDGQLAGNSYLADYPQYLPGVSADAFTNNSPGWMLLSLRKPVTVSSVLGDFAPSLAVDESIQTWWSAATGSGGEWIQVDLGRESTVQALQVNFADEGSTIYDRLRNDAYRYKAEVSRDGRSWTILVDRSMNNRDAPHDYIQLPEPVSTRFVRLTNLHTPAGAKFSVSGLRIFGNSSGPAPGQVVTVKAERAIRDGRCARIRWSPAANTEFYIVRYGVSPDRLFSNSQVYDGCELELSVLNSGVDYYFTVDAVNSRTVTPGSAAVKMSATWDPASSAPKPLSRSGWKVSASNVTTQDPLLNAIDGDTATRWSTGTNQTNGQWFQIDMGSIQAFGSIVLDSSASPSDSPASYQVVASNDGVHWGKPIANGSGAPRATVIAFPPTKARYVRIIQTGNYGLWWSIHEINIFPPTPPTQPSVR